MAVVFRYTEAVVDGTVEMEGQDGWWLFRSENDYRCHVVCGREHSPERPLLAW